MCRQFIVDGYFIAEKLIDDAVLDLNWNAYETALRDGVISVKPESHGEGDPWPGRKLEWWIDANEATLVRDYYRLETERGSRFWVFRDGPAGQGGLWWLHGVGDACPTT